MGTKTAGDPTTINVTAYDLYGNVNTNYDGTATADLSGLVSPPGCTDCTPGAAGRRSRRRHPDVDGWRGHLERHTRAFKADTAAQLMVTDGSISNSSNIFTVTNGTALGGFTIDPVGMTPTRRGSVPVTIRAYDLYGNPKLDYTTGGTLSGLATSPGCFTCVPGLNATPATYGGPISWLNGIGTATVTAYNAQPGAQLTITDGSISNTSKTFTVNPATALKGFTIGTVGTKTAGGGFDVVGHGL